ncbi:MAG TPA: hypothetical protein VGD78_17665 [Chthoniobacterales bacterium]
MTYEAFKGLTRGSRVRFIQDNTPGTVTDAVHTGQVITHSVPTRRARVRITVEWEHGEKGYLDQDDCELIEVIDPDQA